MKVKSIKLLTMVLTITVLTLWSPQPAYAWKFWGSELTGAVWAIEGGCSIIYYTYDQYVLGIKVNTYTVRHETGFCSGTPEWLN
jgi:hypothetical protein